MRASSFAVCLVCSTALTLGAQDARLDSALRALEARGFSGVVRVDRDGATLLDKGYGLANRADRTPFSPTTVVQIGSNTKDFTVVALLQLHERGRLSIRDSLAKYFLTAPADKRNITLWQLVNHVAGFPIGLGGDFDAVTRDAFIAAAMARPLNFPPGTGEQYSNTGFALLAAVIEKVSGQTYDEFVRDNILVPVGLENTGFLLPNFDKTRLAHGYRNGDDQGTMLDKAHAADGPYWNLRGNGGMMSTTGDMLAFYRALFETNKLLKPETRRLRFNPDEPVGLAGSDLVNFFLYERLPGRKIEIVIATNNAEMRAPVARAAIGGALGIPGPGDGPRAAAGPRANAKQPAPAVAAVINAFVAAINTGDAVALRKFIDENFLIEAGTPSAEQRAQRLAGTHGNLGEIKVTGLDEVQPGTVEVSIMTKNEGAATLRLAIDAGTKPRIKTMQIMVGG